jgi:hypothetical protein
MVGCEPIIIKLIGEESRPMLLLEILKFSWMCELRVYMRTNILMISLRMTWNFHLCSGENLNHYGQITPLLFKVQVVSPLPRTQFCLDFGTPCG